jgi:hypothetical protein
VHLLNGFRITPPRLIGCLLVAGVLPAIVLLPVSGVQPPVGGTHEKAIVDKRGGQVPYSS